MLDPTSDNLQRAKRFVLRKWRERSEERGYPRPNDLSGACKFASLFVQQVFGGKLRGNEWHQFVVREGIVIDLAEDVEDVKAMPHPYRHDRSFWNNPEHRESLSSCTPRVKRWVEEFLRGAP